MTAAQVMEAGKPLQQLLKKIAEEQDYDGNPTIKNVISGASIMSSLFYATLRKKGKKDLKLFAKVAAWSEKMRKDIPITCPYTIELYFYKTLRKQYEKLEETFAVPGELRFRAPKLYGYSKEYLCETLVFENLVARGYEGFNRQNSADLEYMTAGISLMAQFHALSLAYAWHDPEGFAQASEHFKMDEEKVVSWLKVVTPKMLANALSVTETHKDKLRNYFQQPNSFQEAKDLYHRQNKNILVHGDFKPSNLMHRRRNGKLEMVLVDFQIVHDGDAVNELMYFIFTATDEEFRRAHYQELLELYYERLKASLLGLHVPEQVYSEKIYRMRLEECAMSGLVMSVAFLPVVLVDESKAPRFNEEDADMNDFAVESSALYKERFNGVLNNYVEWGLL